MRVLRKAECDVDNAATFYTKPKSRRLARSFVLAVHEAYARIRTNPRLGARHHEFDNVRWVMTKGFPFKVIYAVGPELTIIAVFHGARRPDGWHERVDEV